MEWGDPIDVNGVQPDWLRATDMCDIKTALGWRYSTHGVCNRPPETWGWKHDDKPNILAIRLPADHPYYTVQRYNETHGTSFTYWSGGGAAPADWDGGEVLLRIGGVIVDIGRWYHRDNEYDIIGYTKRAGALPADLMDRMVRLIRDMNRDGNDGGSKTDEHYNTADAIAALLPPEPVDPLLQRAREIVADECRGEAEAQSFRNGMRDGSVAVQAVLVALRQG